MTIYEIMKIHESFFRRLTEERVSLHDIRYLPMVEEYRSMKERHKTMYVIGYLASKYHLTERGVQKIIGRFSREMKL